MHMWATRRYIIIITISVIALECIIIDNYMQGNCHEVNSITDVSYPVTDPNPWLELKRHDQNILDLVGIEKNHSESAGITSGITES